MSPALSIPHTAPMREQRPAFPPPIPTPTPADVPASTPTRLRHPAALFAAAFALGMTVAGTIGSGIGALVYSQGASNCTPSDGWCELGAAILALLVGLAVGAIAYIVVGVVTIFRYRPPGSRSSHVIGHLVFPFAAFILLGAIGNLLG
jgi:hypothetical protein